MKQQAGLEDLDKSAIAESQALQRQGFVPQPISCRGGQEDADILWTKLIRKMEQENNA